MICASNSRKELMSILKMHFSLHQSNALSLKKEQIRKRLLPLLDLSGVKMFFLYIYVLKLKEDWVQGSKEGGWGDSQELELVWELLHSLSH
jgi:hypothetical protein